ncbi:MAG TPA: TlpA disulfide reductase family protein [Nitrososphaeraceae archaeon]|jgi:thiol-disulfide isomerase/thioredoxin
MSKFTILKSKKVLVSIVIVVVAAIIGSVLVGSFSSSTSAAPNFKLRTIEGSQVSLSSFKGKPVILWFMAAWCPTCVGQSDAITKVKSEFGTKIDLLVIDMWTTQAIGGNSADGKQSETIIDLQDFLAKHGGSKWKAALDTDKAVVKYGILEVDSTVIVDKNGNIAFKNLGSTGYQPLKEAVSKIATT